MKSLPYRLRDKEAAKRHRDKYYQEHKAEYFARNAAKRDVMRQHIIDVKNSTPCAHCHVQYPHYVMDFHHKDGSEKNGIVSRIINNLSWKKLTDEIAKCEVLCANCHRIETFSHRVVTPKTGLRAKQRDEVWGAEQVKKHGISNTLH